MEVHVVKSETVVVDTSRVFAVAGEKTIAGRAPRLRFIRSFNNVMDVRHVYANVDGTTRDGYEFRSTWAVARGVASLGGLTVYHRGGDKFVAVAP